MTLNSNDVIRSAPAECRRQIHSGAPCRVCGRRHQVMHFPIEQRGAFCADHCGCNTAMLALDHDRLALALALVDD